MTSSLQAGDRVLCYHGPKLYEAKILQIDSTAPSKKYQVHYKGWKSKWDEWVEIKRLVTYNDNGLSLQKNLAELHSNIADQCPATSETQPSPPEVISTATEPPLAKTELPVIFKLGKHFKYFSSADWNQITKKSKILLAPTSVTAADFLQQYAKDQKNESTTLFVRNLLSLLDISIGKNLLYRQERLHYMSLDRKVPPTSLYGPIVLVRFFARLNSLLQKYADSPVVNNFAAEFSKLSDHLISYLRTLDLDSCYVEMSEHYRSIYMHN